jgi:8-oxoguanine deaminase
VTTLTTETPCTWIKQPLATFTGTAADASDGIVVSNGVITQIIGKGQSPAGRIDSVFDARQHVLLPGLINTHHHFYQTLTRAMPDAVNKKLFDWLRSLYPVWAGLSPEMIQSSSQVALIELLQSGCTTTADHHYIFSNQLENAIDIEVEAAEAIGCRVVLARGSMSLGEEDGGLPPRKTIQCAETIMEDSERVIKKFHNRGAGAFVQIALAPCSPFSVSEDLMKSTALLAREQDVRLHTHLAETQDEEAFCLQRFGVRPLEYLEQMGWLHSGTWVAHGVHFNKQEISQLGSAKVGITHCPTSNMLLGSGICRGVELEHAGAKMGIGVDGSASNDSGNLITEVRQAMYLQKLRYSSERFTHLDALRWATSGSASVLGRTDIGKLEVGYCADLTLFKLDELAFAGSHDPLAALLLCQAHRADCVMVGGEWRVKDREVIGVDVQRLIVRHRELSLQLAKGL